MSSDAELMQAVQQGDLSAFEQIVLRHQALVWSTACRFLNDAAEAEDMAQEAFLRVLDAAPRYRPTAQFKTYLLQIVARLCLDRLRKKRPLCTDNLPERPDDGKTPDDALIEQERHQQVRRAMEQLPTQQRMALSLRYDNDLSYEEIADVLRISVKAVERSLARGRAALAVRLGESRKDNPNVEGVLRP
jgi:RNA polymerase sigma-70 factor (ECF subfamily)